MELPSGGGGRSSSELAILVRQGRSSNSNSTSAHHRFTRDMPEKSVELERLWRGRGQRKGITSKLGIGDGGRRPARLGCGYL